MAHALDNALTLPQRTIVRNGAVALLSGLLKPAGFLGAVIPWGGIVRGYTDDRGIDELLSALSGQSPAIAVSCGDRTSKAEGMGGFQFGGDLELTLYHYNDHPGSLTLGRMAADGAALALDTRDPGLEFCMQIAEELVVGQRAGVGDDTAGGSIKQIVPRLEEELFTENARTLWAQRYAVKLVRSINPKRGVKLMLTAWENIVRTSDQPALADGGIPVAGADGQP